MGRDRLSHTLLLLGLLWLSRCLYCLCSIRLCGEFAGILQGKIRQGMSGVRILMVILCERSIQSFLQCDAWPNRHRTIHRMLTIIVP